MLNPAQQRGFTLVELMVGMTLGLVILSGAIALYARTVSATTASLQGAHLHQQLQAIMAILTQDIRRAGYYGITPSSDAPEHLIENPFADTDDPDKPVLDRNDLRLSHYQTGDPDHDEPADSCILYSYDLNGDGVLTPQGAGMERFGFRLRRGSIQMRYGGQGFDCRLGSWRTVSDPDIRITQLAFSLHQSDLHPQLGVGHCTDAAPCLQLRSVAITLSAQLAHSPDIALTLRGQVHIRNDRLRPELPGT